MAIPDFDEHGVLPPGVHECTMPELIERFGITTWRKQLLTGLQKVVAVLRKDFPQPIYIDGGFVTSITKPSDIDVVIDMLRAKQEDQTKVFRLMLSQRQRWGKWGVDFMPELPRNAESFIDIFQRVGPNSAARLGVTPNHPKGILLLKS